MPKPKPKPKLKKLKLSEWLNALANYGPPGILLPTTGELMKVLTKWGRPNVADYLAAKNSALEWAQILQVTAMRDVPGSQRSWVYHDDWRWRRDEARDAFARMLELPAPVQPEPDEVEQMLYSYAERCNESAIAAGVPKRLYLIGPSGDDHVFIAVTPEQFENLVASGAVVAAY